MIASTPAEYLSALHPSERFEVAIVKQNKWVNPAKGDKATRVHAAIYDSPSLAEEAIACNAKNAIGLYTSVNPTWQRGSAQVDPGRIRSAVRRFALHRRMHRNVGRSSDCVRRSGRNANCIHWWTRCNSADKRSDHQPDLFLLIENGFLRKFDG